MPPAYPNWNDFHPNLPDAAPEDTDRRVLEQTLAIYVRHAPALDPGVAE